MDWFAWMGSLIKLIGDLVPVREKVPPTHRGVKFRGMTQICVFPPGVYWYWPWRSEFHQIVVARQTLFFEEQDATTADNKTVKVRGTVTYQVGETSEAVIQAAVHTWEIEDQIDNEAMAVYCDFVSSRTFDAVRTDRESADAALTEMVQAGLEDYGIIVIREKANILRNRSLPPAPGGNVTDYQPLYDFLTGNNLGTTRQLEKLQAVVLAGSTRKAARKLDIGNGEIDKAVARLRKIANEAGYSKTVEEKVRVEHGDGGVDVRVVCKMPKTEAEIMADAELDPSVWRVKSVRKWPTTLKIREGDKEMIVQAWNYHFVFERLIAKPIHEAIEGLFKHWKPVKPKAPPRRKNKQHLVEMDLLDAHFGKLCWDEGTGAKDYDLREAAGCYANAIAELLGRVAHHDVAEFLLPVGNDFFQTDNWLGTTTRGTPVAHDDRITKVFQAGFAAIESAISSMLEIAPVRCVWVPGNHDLNTSWHLFHSLAQRFRGSKHVTIDLSQATKRTYIEWGESVIGFQHGDKMKPERMVIVASTEFPDWSRKQFREIHCGHQHTRKNVSFLSASEHAGTLVRYLAALSGTDEWHYDNGFVSNKRAAEAIVWHKDEGPIATAVSFTG